MALPASPWRPWSLCGHSWPGPGAIPASGFLRTRSPSACPPNAYTARVTQHPPRPPRNCLQGDVASAAHRFASGEAVDPEPLALWFGSPGHARLVGATEAKRPQALPSARTPVLPRSEASTPAPRPLPRAFLRVTRRKSHRRVRAGAASADVKGGGVSKAARSGLSLGEEKLECPTCGVRRLRGTAEQKRSGHGRATVTTQQPGSAFGEKELTGRPRGCGLR